MTTETPAAPSMSGSRANRLAVQIETISEDCHCPVEISSRANPEDICTQFGVCSLLPTVNIPPGASEIETARAIAKVLDDWSIKLAAVASVLRIRFPQ